LRPPWYNPGGSGPAIDSQWAQDTGTSMGAGVTTSAKLTWPTTTGSDQGYPFTYPLAGEDQAGTTYPWIGLRFYIQGNGTQPSGNVNGGTKFVRFFAAGFDGFARFGLYVHEDGSINPAMDYAGTGFNSSPGVVNGSSALWDGTLRWVECNVRVSGDSSQGSDLPSFQITYNGTVLTSSDFTGTPTGGSWVGTRWYADTQNSDIRQIANIDFMHTMNGASPSQTITGGSFNLSRVSISSGAAIGA
jgi:hypothetical protein